MSQEQKKAACIVIKKYPNRRLYDTETSSYITLEDLCDYVKRGVEFEVRDAKSDEDLTHQTLTQIIFDQEAKGYTLLPDSFLRGIIRFYDNKLGGVLQHYLEASMQSFLAQQDRMQNVFGRAFEVDGGKAAYGQLEEMTRQNVALFEKTIKMFNPFGAMFNAREEEADVQAAPLRQKRSAR